jgi:hypothetical protein
MNRNNNFQKRFPNYYNHPLLENERRKEGVSLRALAAELEMDRQTVTRVFRGTATQKQVWPVAQRFRFDWPKLHDLTLLPSESHRAILTPVRRIRAVN